MNRIVVTIDGLVAVDADDSDESAIIFTLRRYAECIERFGLKNTLRVLARDRKLRDALFVESSPSHCMLSTVVNDRRPA